MAEEEYDLVIIGGGIIGAWAAYLAGRDNPARRVLLIERSMIGTGATQFSVGLDIPYGYTPLRRELALQSNELYAELRREIPGLPIHDLPLFGLVPQERMDEIIGNFVLPGVHQAAADELRPLYAAYPALEPGVDHAVITGVPCSHTVPSDIARVLADNFRRRFDGECREGAEVLVVEPRDDRWSIHLSDGRTVIAGNVIDATGPWMGYGPSHAFADNRRIRVKKVAAMHVESPPPPGAPVLFLFNEDAFLLPLEDKGRWLFSFTLQVWDVLPRSELLALTAADRAAALAVLKRYTPWLVEHCTSARVFCDAYAPDWTPVIGRVGKGYVAAGAGAGSGYRLAPAIARHALQLLEQTEADQPWSDSPQVETTVMNHQ